MRTRYLFPFITTLASTPIWADVNVVTDISPIAGIVNAVGQDLVTTTMLIEPDQSAHHITLRPSQAGAITDADLVVIVGQTLTPGLYDRIQSLGASTIVSMEHLNGVELHSHSDEHDSDDHEGEHDDHDAEGEAHDDHDHANGIDPHLWLSPENATILATEIRDQLIKLSPEHTKDFRQNHTAFVTKLDAIMAAAPKPADHATIGVSHDAFAYFQESLGHIETIVLTDALGSAPSPRAVADAHHALENSDVACFIIDPQSQTALGKALADEYGIPMVTLSPIATAQGTFQNAYLDLMQSLVDGFSTCLGVIK